MAIQYHDPLDRTFHALGDGTRRQIVAMLAARGACSATEIRKPFDAAQPTISKHLKVLEKAGLVAREIDGRTHRFRLETEPMKEATDWIERHRVFWEATLARLDAFVLAQDAPEDET
ncbi:MAG: metalloregulator ArsR/SmtB family transcription factor [Pseudomonadota bacterium]